MLGFKPLVERKLLHKGLMTVIPSLPLCQAGSDKLDIWRVVAGLSQYGRSTNRLCVPAGSCQLVALRAVPAKLPASKAAWGISLALKVIVAQLRRRSSCVRTSSLTLLGKGSQRRMDLSHLLGLFCRLRCYVRPHTAHYLGPTFDDLRCERRGDTSHVEPFFNSRTPTPTMSLKDMSRNFQTTCGCGLVHVALHRGLCQPIVVSHRAPAVIEATKLVLRTCGSSLFHRTNLQCIFRAFVHVRGRRREVTRCHHGA